jgi:hypothetical protein
MAQHRIKLIAIKGRLCHKFPKYHAKKLIGHFNAKLGGEDFFKPTIWSSGLCEVNNDNGFREVDFVTSINMVVKNKMLPHRCTHKLTKTSHNAKTINLTII